MIALTLVRAIERHANELSDELVTKLATSPRTNDLRKVPAAELQRQIEGVLLHLSEWLLTKTTYDVERRYLELAERRASQGVALSDFCWAIVLTKEHLWEFLERQGFRRGPVEIYGEMELLHLLDQFLIGHCALQPKAMSSTASCRMRRALNASFAGSRIGYRLRQRHLV